MNNNLPPCPLASIDRDVVQQYIERDDILAEKVDRLRSRTFGKRVFRSFRLRATISHLKGAQTEARNMYPDVLSDETIDSYNMWIEALYTSLEPY